MREYGRTQDSRARITRTLPPTAYLRFPPTALPAERWTLTASRKSPSTTFRTCQRAGRPAEHSRRARLPDATTATKGAVIRADAAAITAGTAGRVVDAEQLQSATSGISGLNDRALTITGGNAFTLPVNWRLYAGLVVVLATGSPRSRFFDRETLAALVTANNISFPVSSATFIRSPTNSRAIVRHTGSVVITRATMVGGAAGQSGFVFQRVSLFRRTNTSAAQPAAPTAATVTRNADNTDFVYGNIPTLWTSDFFICSNRIQSDAAPHLGIVPTLRRAGRNIQRRMENPGAQHLVRLYPTISLAGRRFADYSGDVGGVDSTARDFGRGDFLMIRSGLIGSPFGGAYLWGVGVACQGFDRDVDDQGRGEDPTGSILDGERNLRDQYRDLPAGVFSAATGRIINSARVQGNDASSSGGGSRANFLSPIVDKVSITRNSVRIRIPAGGETLTAGSGQSVQHLLRLSPVDGTPGTDVNNPSTSNLVTGLNQGRAMSFRAEASCFCPAISCKATSCIATLPFARLPAPITTAAAAVRRDAMAAGGSGLSRSNRHPRTRRANPPWLLNVAFE